MLKWGNDKLSKAFVLNYFKKSGFPSNEFKGEFSPFDILLRDTKTNDDILVEVKRVLKPTLEDYKLMIEQRKFESAKEKMIKSNANHVLFIYLFTIHDRDEMNEPILSTERYTKMHIFHFTKDEVIAQEFGIINAFKNSNKEKREDKSAIYLPLSKLKKTVYF